MEIINTPLFRYFSFGIGTWFYIKIGTLISKSDVHEENPMSPVVLVLAMIFNNAAYIAFALKTLQPLAPDI